MNPTDPPDPALYLALSQQQITAPHAGARETLAPNRSLAGWLWANAGRIAPAVVTTAAWALARMWHEQLPVGSAEPLWVMGGLGGLAAAAGVVSAAKPHGDSGITATAFAAAATAAMSGAAAWTPRSALSVLLWLLGMAAVYALCVKQWRKDKQEVRQHAHDIDLKLTEGFNQARNTAIRTAGKVEIAHAAERVETLKVEAITAASNARIEAEARAAKESRILLPGDELDVPALVAAWNSSAPVEPSASERNQEGGRR